MPNAVLTDDEIVSYIKRSSLINILIEGPDDMMIYNHIEEQINQIQISFMPCGGRETLKKVYNRRGEFVNKKVIFIADKDLWLFSGIPIQYHDIIFTSGYSIENDLFQYGGDLLLKLMLENEKAAFYETLDNLIVWYCSEVTKHISGGAAAISVHLNQIIPVGSSEICPNFLATYIMEEPDLSLCERVKGSSYLHLRGKFLFQAMVRVLSARSRRSKFSYENLLELCLLTENDNFRRIINEVLLKSA